MYAPDTESARAPYVMFPIEFPELWRAYKLAQSSFWTADEIAVTEDVEQWRSTLTEGERKLFSHILGFFAAADGIVVENLALRFCAEITVPEVRCFYAYQMMIENVHAEVYSKFIQELFPDPAKQMDIFSSIKSCPAIEAKGEWCIRWIDAPDASLPTRILAFAIVEGIFFSSSFAAIFWLRHRNIMPALTFSNELIARDEGQHTSFACLLYNHLREPVSAHDASGMVRGAVTVEQDFFASALNGTDIVGLTEPNMNEYIEYVADFLLIRLGYDKIYHTDNPFPFMERTAIDAKTNFFERQVSEYHGAPVKCP
ncbi:ribonucleotide reductase small subunit [Daedaleopsis nitida]|nr:ribonucleotide reductase small subunit [Daedaleopsis nitida]